MFSHGGQLTYSQESPPAPADHKAGNQSVASCDCGLITAIMAPCAIVHKHQNVF